MDLSKTPAKTGYRYFQDQFDDEAVLYVFRKHPIVMRKGLIISLGSLLIGPVYSLILLNINPTNPPSIQFFFGSLLISFFIGLVILLPSWISWYFSVFILTNQRFIQIIQKGFFHRSVADIKLQQIQSISYELSGLQQTLLGYGPIKFQTYIGDFIIHDVHHPGKIQKKIQTILKDLNITSINYAGETNEKEEFDI